MMEVPVLVVGGGPVGMTLALNLARYGVRSILVERNPATTRHPKMDLTNGRSMELFRRLGIAEQLRDAGVPRANAFDISWVTSLVGHELHRFNYPSADDKRAMIHARNDGSQCSEPPLRVSQVQIEPVLKQAIDENPLIDVHFGTAFERIVAEDETGITSEISDGSGGNLRLVRTRYVAACDGGGSRVRRRAGIDLDGEMAVAGAHMVHFRTDARDLLQRWGPVYHLQTGRGTIIAQNDHDIYTLQAWLIPGLGVEDMRAQDVLENWVGTKFEYEILQANPWTANFVVAQHYRAGLVLLAGDAAHQFIPTGGYGMNSGIADAAGLSWVLAACVHGWGGDRLLDAYDAERRPTAWWHLEASRRHMGVRLAIGAVYAEAGDLDDTGPEANARREAAGRRIEELGNAENESWGVEYGYRYDQSPVICTEPDAPAIDPLTYHPGTWPGVRLPHVYLNDGQSVHDKLGLWFTLLAVDTVDGRAIEAAAQGLGIPLATVSLHRPDLIGIYERGLVLVRPDQHVAWRGDSLPDDLERLLLHVTGRS